MSPDAIAAPAAELLGAALLAEARAHRDELLRLLGPYAPESIAARAASLLASAERNPAIRITDRTKAAAYFRSRAIAELDKERRRR